jgi:nucleotide-binding universal stress UspA family protein
MPVDRIVVGTDGSDSAARAVGHAARLAGTAGAELVVVHVYRTGDPSQATTPRNLGASLLRDVSARHSEGLTVRPVLKEGPAAEVLVSLAADESAGLVVVGNRGLGNRRVLMGTVPARVAAGAPCDVFIAHTTPIDHPEVGRVLIATDGSATARRAEATGARWVSALGAESETLRVTEGDPAAGIVRAATERRADLIVVGNKGLTGMRRFLTSVPSRVARHAPCHVLLVKTT